MNIVPEHPNRGVSIGAILTLMGSLVWIQLQIDFTKFDIAAIILFAAAFVNCVSLKFADYRENTIYKDNIISDDVNKINNIIRIIDSNQFYILIKKEIQTYMEDDDYDGLFRIIYYKENDIFPFHNEKIQNLYERFSLEVQQFYSDFYNIYTSNGRGMSTWRPSGEKYVSDEIYEEIQAEIAVLNRKASKLADLWEELINVSRQELKGASKTIERYDV